MPHDPAYTTELVSRTLAIYRDHEAQLRVFEQTGGHDVFSTAADIQRCLPLIDVRYQFVLLALAVHDYRQQDVANACKVSQPRVAQLYLEGLKCLINKMNGE